jgi:hypothetical protein
MLPACALPQVLANSSRASWMFAARRGLCKVTSGERKAMPPLNCRYIAIALIDPD